MQLKANRRLVCLRMFCQISPALFFHTLDVLNHFFQKITDQIGCGNYPDHGFAIHDGKGMEFVFRQNFRGVINGLFDVDGRRVRHHHVSDSKHIVNRHVGVNFFLSKIIRKTQPL